MSPDRWQRIESLFESALELDPAERASWLEHACVDPDVRREVAQMLRAHERADGVLEREAPLASPDPPLGFADLAEMARGSTDPDSAERSLPTTGDSTPDPAVVMIGPYRIERELGRGGMGIVYRAQDERLDRPVALKLLARHLGNDPGARARFQAEARAASALDHPNICTVYDIGRSADGRDYIAMAFYDGETLADRIARAPVPADRILRIVLDVAEGLAAAHARGVVHRDVKPSNIMLTERGETKVLDFGVAKLESGADLTQPGVPMGTVAYMSPEQARGERVGSAADLWALGVVLYESLSGSRPFTGDHLRAVLRAIVDDPLPPLPQTEVPAEVAVLVQELLQKEPTRRLDAVSLARRVRQVLAPGHSDEPGAGISRRFEASSDAGERSIGTSTDRDRPETAVGHAHRSLQLPETLTRFFGRTRELESARTILHAARLLTLTGPAGTGKTRLSLEIAQSLDTEFPGGIHFVPLATISDPGLVPSAIARSLMPEAMLPADPLESIRQLLRDRTALLILDNFEQVVSAAPVVSQILLGCPAVKVIATSRVVLRVSGEHAFAVPPLELVSASEIAAMEDLEKGPATALFLDRAHAADPLFEFDLEAAREIAAICERLDGIPLAIELAAARVRSFPPKELLARLGRRLEMLRGGGRDRPSRHQTLRQAIEWSYALLDPARQRLFRWLAVFSGGFSFETAERLDALMMEGVGARVGGDSTPTSPIDPSPGSSIDSTPASSIGLAPASSISSSLGSSVDSLDVVEGIEDLFDHSLLRRDPAKSRFSTLETIREFALERLRDSGELDRAESCHTAWVIELAENADRAFTGPYQKEWFDRCDLELDNLRSALARARRNHDPESGLRIAGAIWRFWLARGHLREGREQFSHLLRLDDSASAPPAVRARALHGLATLCHNQGDNPIARTWLEEELEIWRKLGDRRGIADTLNNLGWTACELTDLVPARALSEEALALGHELGEERTIAVALNNLGWVANYQSDHATAITRQEENLRLRRRLGDQRGIGFALANLAWAHESRGAYAEAMALANQAIEMLGELQDDLLQAMARSVAGSIDHNMGELEAARASLQSSCDQWERVGNPSGFGWAATKLGRLLIDQGEFATAETMLARADEAWQIVREQAGKGRWHLAVAALRATQGRFEEAAEEARRSLELRFATNDRQGIAESVEILAEIAAERGRGDPTWMLAAAGVIRSTYALPAGWPAQRIRERVLAHLQRSSTELPDLAIEAVTPAALRHAAEAV